MDSSEKSKVIEYWTHVHSLMHTIKLTEVSCKSEDLQFFINTITSSHLLNQIECHSLQGNIWVDNNPVPFTSWLLQRLLYAAQISPDIETANFYIEAQTKLLRATFNRSNYDFTHLLQLFIATLNKILQVALKEKFFCFQKTENIYMESLLLDAIKFEIENEYQRKSLFSILISVLAQAENLLQYAIQPIYDELWTLVLILSQSNCSRLLFLSLPIISKILKSGYVPENKSDISKLAASLPLIIPHLSSELFQDLFLNTWKDLKELFDGETSHSFQLIENFLKVKNCGVLQHFILSEMGFFISKSSDTKELTDSILKQCKWEESTLLMEEIIVSDLTKYLTTLKNNIKHSHLLSGNSTHWIDVQKESASWKGLLKDFNNLLEAPEPVIFISQLVNVVSNVLKSLSNLISDKSLAFSFFGDFFVIAIQKCCSVIDQSYVRTSSHNDLACKTMATMLNLAESRLCPEQSLTTVTNYLQFKLKSFNTLSTDAKFHLVRCVRCIPYGISPKLCCLVFKEICANPKNDLNLCELILTSVPNLYLSLLNGNDFKESFAAQLIADLLLPAVFSEIESMQAAALNAAINLMCCLSGSGFFVGDNHIIKCCLCENVCLTDDNDNNDKRVVTTIEPHLIKLLQPLFSSSYSGVRKQLVSLVPRLAVHMKAIRYDNSFREKFFSLMSSDDLNVLQTLNDVINTLITRKSSEGNVSVHLPALAEFFKAAKKEVEKYTSLEQWGPKGYCLLKCIINVACIPFRDVLKESLLLIVSFVSICPLLLGDFISRVALVHKTTPSKLFFSYRPEISKVLAEQIIKNFSNNQCPLEQILTSMVSLFRDLSPGRFFQASEQFIVPLLLLSAAKNHELKSCIEDFASYFSKSTSILIANNFHFVFCQTWLKHTEAEFDNVIAFIEKETNFRMLDLMTQSQKQLIHELLFHYHIDEDRMLNATHRVLSMLSNYQLPPTLSLREQVSYGLESRFVGYLLFAVGKFTKEMIAESEQVKAVQSLTSVLRLMGEKYVTLVSRKVLSTLITSLTLDLKTYASIHCECWGSFVKVVDIREVGPLIPTVVISILPLLEYCPDGVSQILDYLLVKNINHVAPYMSALTFLPKHPVLGTVHRTIQKYTDFLHEDIKDRIMRQTGLCTHETVKIRIEGLQELSITLKVSSKDVQNLISGSDEPHSVIVSLWDALAMGCRDPDNNINAAAALCLGQLGALDPGLLPRKLKPNQLLPLSAHTLNFGILALKELVHHFQNARTSVDMDAFALAIQELLKIYEITPESNVWSNFTDSEKSLMTPMIKSRYKINASTNRTTWPEIIFYSKEANSHISWGSKWAGKLIAACKDSNSKALFSACEPCMKRDPSVLQLFLRYILVQVIIQGSVEEAGVFQEIDAIFKFCLSNQEGSTRDCNVNMPTSEGRMCAMTIFLILDFVQFWIRQFLVENATINADHLKKREYLRFKEFLTKINVMKVIKCNYEMLEYPRVVQYLEDLIIETPNSLSELLPMLSKTFALYGDLDNVCGASNLQQSAASVEDQLFYHQVSKQFEELRIIYERLCEEGPLSASQIEGMVQCYLSLGEPSTALNIIASYEVSKPQLSPLLAERTVESLLKLGDWNQLETYMESDKAKLFQGWFKHVGNSILDINDGRNVQQRILESRLHIITTYKMFGVHSANEQQLYPCLLRFQILYELQRVAELIENQNPETVWSDVQSLMEEWQSKITLLQSDGEFLEHLFGIRRNLLNILSNKVPVECSKMIRDEIAEYWNKSASLARKTGCYHQAYNYILNAEKFNIRSTFIEKAQLFWDKGDQETCLSTLSRGLREMFPDANSMKDCPSGERLADRKVCAEAKLLFAIYNEETSNCDSYTNMTNYQEAFDVCRQLEKTQVHLGQCLDRVVSRMDESEQDGSKACDLRVMIVNHFGKSLMNGCEFIYQTVPRMLTIWLDLGENLKTPDRLKAMQKINKMIQQFNEKLPPFVFMTALPQLLSRIGHPNREVFLLLKTILASLIRAFPQQCLWAMQTVAKSSIPDRCIRYKEVIQDMSLRTAETFKLIEDITLLCDKLNRLTNKSLPADATTKNLSISSVVRELPLLFNSSTFSSVILPITKCCRITLPRTDTLHSHTPFPKNAVTIINLKNELTVLPSLQRPRKIRFLGSDGYCYDILCKPKDDLRRDARLMEFNNIVNMYLHRDPEARARHLHIRTYVVTPLGESGGLLEWVPNLVGLRPALIQLYKQHGKYITTREIKKMECLVRDPLPKKREVFLQKLLPAHPPIFHEWFRVTFSDPAGWYAARQAYTRTTAVMSMVGYILGLGDRHGENILYDCESGDTVHVDFNCLFNKGENFDWKERVPFRLTHNMVIAMGPCGVEGAFRKACEASMRVLRAQGKTLMSVLTPFAYDPFGSWGKNKEIGQQERDQKISEAFEELSDIDKRLKGSLRIKQKNNTFYLSVEGLVRALINEATSIDNLCQMYLGWGAYL